MTPLLRRAFAAGLIACVAGCATRPAPPVPTATVSPSKTGAVAAERVRNAVAIGRSTKADVRAALGETQAIRFESGYEVWIYRVAADPNAKASRAPRGTPEATGEFVVLFAPSGLVSKTRLRPAPTEPKG